MKTVGREGVVLGIYSTVHIYYFSWYCVYMFRFNNKRFSIPNS